MGSTTTLIKHLVIVTLCGALLSCSSLLGFDEARHRDGGSEPRDAVGDAVIPDGAADAGPSACKFDDPGSTFDGSCFLAD